MKVSERLIKNVSVILPIYNGSKVLHRSVHSVLSQSYKNFELIIVNDGSTDSTEEIIKGIKDERIIYIKQENKGASSARNRGVKEAQGKYIAFLDADDYWSPSHLSDHIKYLEKHSDYVMSFNRYIAVEKDKQKLHAWNNQLSGNIYPKLLFIENNIIGTPSVVIRKDILEQSGLFDENMSMCEDLDLWRRISRLGKVRAISKPSTYVVLREGQFNPQRYLEGRYDYIKKAVKEDTQLDNNIIALLLIEMWIFYLSSGCSFSYIAENMSVANRDFPEIEQVIQKKMQRLDVLSWLKNQVALAGMDKSITLYKVKYGLRLIYSQGFFNTLKNIFQKLIKK